MLRPHVSAFPFEQGPAVLEENVGGPARGDVVESVGEAQVEHQSLERAHGLNRGANLRAELEPDPVHPEVAKATVEEAVRRDQWSGGLAVRADEDDAPLEAREQPLRRRLVHRLGRHLGQLLPDQFGKVFKRRGLAPARRRAERKRGEATQQSLHDCGEFSAARQNWQTASGPTRPGFSFFLHSTGAAP